MQPASPLNTPSLLDASWRPTPVSLNALTQSIEHLVGGPQLPPGFIGLSHGYAGLALTELALHLQSNVDRRLQMHGAVQAALGILNSQGYDRAPLGFMDGLSGLAFAVYRCSGVIPSYVPAFKVLDTYLIERIAPSIESLRTQPYTLLQFDLVTGLAGLFHYAALTGGLTACLPELITVMHGRIGHAAWTAEGLLCTPACEDSDVVRSEIGSGAVNIGVAHGLYGHLAALSNLHICRPDLPLASRQQIREMLETLRDWLINARTPQCSQTRWAAQPGNLHEPHPDTGAGWCYGASGRGAALILAGRALQDGLALELGTEQIEEALTITTRAMAVRPALNTTLCHGVPSVLACATPATPFLTVSSRAMLEDLTVQYAAQAHHLHKTAVDSLDHDDTTGGLRDTADKGVLIGQSGGTLALLAPALAAQVLGVEHAS